jgi:hypothetical protein
VLTHHPPLGALLLCWLWPHQGVGTAEDIDQGLRLGTNQPMGPLRLADFIGEGRAAWGAGLLMCREDVLYRHHQTHAVGAAVRDNNAGVSVHCHRCLPIRQ